MEIWDETESAIAARGVHIVREIQDEVECITERLQPIRVVVSVIGHCFNRVKSERTSVLCTKRAVDLTSNCVEALPEITH